MRRVNKCCLHFDSFLLSPSPFPIKFLSPLLRPFYPAVDSRLAGSEADNPAEDNTNKSHRYKVDFSLRGVPVSDNFIDRPLDSADLERCLLPQPDRQQRKIFVLHGLGGIGKTQLAVNFARKHQSRFTSVFWLDGTSEDRLKRSIAGCAGRLPDQDRDHILKGKPGIENAANGVLKWLQRPDNRDWLLIFDNVDQDYEQGGATCKYDVHEYFPADHGSILITTRQSRLGQLGQHMLLSEVETGIARSIFQRWYGKDTVSKCCATCEHCVFPREVDFNRIISLFLFL